MPLATATPYISSIRARASGVAPDWNWTKPRCLPGARRGISAGSAETISLSLSRRQKGKLKAALEAGHRPIFTVKAVARGKAGTRVPLALKVKPTKP